ncbi:hypothetical protein IMX26_03490 [Clostridium sp. 'deep sea']|uniref:hypothetical protein n=1 Tax=Clostridium sp. 'deep sea' TaxID=2779445 RepID=UPI0018966373|nr:hypothetical protein [Clostridium sp. 'deep sea']QOR35894.1 hypothetical protein IMX26_03490 [Clostridium sp. 'deep sea']
MKKLFKCPVCENSTITFKDKFKTNYRLRTTIICKKCGSELIESNLAGVGILIHCLLCMTVFFLGMKLYIAIILYVITFLPAIYINKYYVPLIKYRK